MTPEFPTLVLDAGAVHAWARERPKVRSFFAAVQQDRPLILVSAVTLAEVVRGDGPREATIHRVLNFTEVVPVSDAIGRHAGKLLARAKSSATVDAVVVATALQVPGGAAVLTSDSDDLTKLSEGERGIEIVSV